MSQPQPSGMARIYDLLYPPGAKVDAMTAVLAELCPAGGRVLELGVGTGRVAVPLAAKGLRVSGVDLDPEMIAVLRARPGGDAVHTVVGDFTTDTVGSDFDVVLLAVNTLFAVPTQAGQIAALTRAAEQVAEGGRVVLEHFDPDVLYRRPNPNNTMRVLSDSSVAYFTTTADFATQGISACYAVHDADGVHTAEESGRYVWPAELDLMARIAGLRLVARNGGWEGQPAGGAAILVSVYSR